MTATEGSTLRCSRSSSGTWFIQVVLRDEHVVSGDLRPIRPFSAAGQDLRCGTSMATCGGVLIRNKSRAEYIWLMTGRRSPCLLSRRPRTRTGKSKPGGVSYDGQADIVWRNRPRARTSFG